MPFDQNLKRTLVSLVYYITLDIANVASTTYSYKPNKKIYKNFDSCIEVGYL